MKVPYCIKGALFAPALLLLLFGLKITCPASAGCFSDIFATPAFLPVAAVYKAFGPVEFVSTHEPGVLLGYWSMVGFFLGLVFDVSGKPVRR